jgi:hypothetical protein
MSSMTYEIATSGYAGFAMTLTHSSLPLLTSTCYYEDQLSTVIARSKATKQSQRFSNE